jgi:hypothetical protein
MQLLQPDARAGAPLHLLRCKQMLMLAWVPHQQYHHGCHHKRPPVDRRGGPQIQRRRLSGGATRARSGDRRRRRFRAVKLGRLSSCKQPHSTLAFGCRG